MNRKDVIENAAADEDNEEGEVELVDGEAVDAEESTRGPSSGEPPPGEPLDEILHVRTLRRAEPSADELDVPEEGLELPGLDEDEEAERPERSAGDGLHRTVIAGDLEAKSAELDEEEVARGRLERAAPAHAAGQIRCTRCFVWKHPTQFDDTERRVCRDCA